MATICENKTLNDSELADEKLLIKIERMKVSFGDKLLRGMSKWVAYSNGWPLLCIYTIVIAMASICIVVYLKMTGEWMPFCLYDNYFYLFYYFFLSVFSAAMIPLCDLEFNPPTSRFWFWARRLGAYCWYLEIEGLAYVVVFFSDIEYDIEFDDEAQAVVWAMATLGFFRFVIVSLSYWVAVHFLTRLQRRNNLSVDRFGRTLTDLCDILVFQLMAQCLYYYEITIHSFAFIVSFLYLYIYWARY